jgi:Flp pilus assembly protein TadG
MRNAREPQQMDRHPERGAVLPIVAITLPVLLAMAAIVIDLGHLYQVRSQLQATADAAALAGAAMLPNATSVGSEAAKYADLNYPGHGTVVKTADVVPGHWNGTSFTAGGTPTNAVRVTARRAQANGNQVPLFLGGFVGKQYSDVGASAVAVRTSTGGGACIYVLHPTWEKAFLVQSTNTVVNTCDVRVNSNRDAGGQAVALNVESQASLLATGFTISVRGGWFKDGSSTWSPVPTTGGVVADPLASLAQPTVPNRCDYTGSPYTIGTNNATWGNTDGYTVWCGGLKIDGGRVASLRPGIHVLRGGGLTISGATINATDVMFYNTCNNVSASCAAGQTSSAQRIEVVGSTAQLNQIAPPSGPYMGLLFFQDRAMGTSFDNTFGSGASLTLDGVMYFPTQHLIIGSQTRILQGNRITFVVSRLTINSTTTLTFKELPSRAPGAILGGSAVALVQ